MENKQGSNVLLIENQAEQTRQIRAMLGQFDPSVFHIVDVESIGDAEKHLATNPVEVVLLDLGIAKSNGLEAFSKLQMRAPHTAILLICDLDDEPVAIQAIHQGAQDYLIKGQIKTRELKRALFNAIQRKSLEEIQTIEKERAQVTLNCIGDAVICTDSRGNITFMNRVAETMTGWELRNAAGRTMADCVRCGCGHSKGNP